MKVQLEEVIRAIEDTGEGVFYYHPEDGSIDEDMDQYAIALPDRYERNDYGNMQKFIATVKDEKAKEWLRNAIKGKGAFRMFRSACERFHLLNDWYDYQDTMHRDLAINWCEANGIYWVEEVYEEDDDEEDVTDFYHTDYSEPTVVKMKEMVETPVRAVELTEKNLLNAVFVADAYLMDQYHGESDLEYAEDQLRLWLESGCRVTVASDKGRYVGLACAEKTGEDLILRAVYVIRDQRRKKIGTMLVKEMEASDYGSDQISLQTMVANERAGSIAFFNSLGYFAVPAVVMRKIKE